MSLFELQMESQNLQCDTAAKKKKKKKQLTEAVSWSFAGLSWTEIEKMLCDDHLSRQTEGKWQNQLYQ